MPSSPPSSLNSAERKHWWLSNKKIVDKYIKDAKVMLATQEQSEITAALSLLDSALVLSPGNDSVIELKARSLLYLRRFKEVADMLQDYIPSVMTSFEESSSSSSSSSSDNLQHFSKEGVRLLLSGESPSREEPKCKCFSVSDLKKKVLAKLGKKGESEGQWRYLVLGQACCHLGLMEDALVLLQTAKRLASEACRRESICWSDDSFSFSTFPISGEIVVNNHPPSPPKTEFETISHLLCHIKFLRGRKTSAIAALNAGLNAEAIRHFTKILESRRGAPPGFLAECYTHRASAYRYAGRIAESLADCNRALALVPSCIDALSTRAALFETIRCITDSLHDLEHLKLLYNTILRDRKLPGSAWKRQYVHYREIPGKLVSLATKINSLKQRVASGETGNVDYYALIGLMKGCSRSELERAHLLLTLRYKPEKSNAFIERCEFADDGDVESVRERANISSLVLYRLIQKGYTNVLRTILDEEAVEKQRKKASVALQAAAPVQQVHHVQQEHVRHKRQSDNAALAAPVQQVHHVQQEHVRHKRESPVQQVHHVQQEHVTHKRESDNAALQAAAPVQQVHHVQQEHVRHKREWDNAVSVNKVNPRASNCNRIPNKPIKPAATTTTASMFQGVFGRDIAAVGNLLSHTGLNLPIAVKYEVALSC